MLHALQTLLAPHSTVYTFGRTVVHLETIRFLPLVWITFRDAHVSLNVALSKLLCETLVLIFSDGGFRLSASMPLMGTVDWSTCSRFTFAFKRTFLEVSN